jgi:hypothetical protein
MEEYIDSRHFSGLYLKFITTIRPSKFLQNTGFALLYEELLKIFLAGTKFSHFHNVVQKIRQAREKLSKGSGIGRLSW